MAHQLHVAWVLRQSEGSDTPAQCLHDLQQVEPVTVVRRIVGMRQPMDSIVHGGFRAIGRIAAGTAPDQLVNVRRNCNGLAPLKASLLVLARADPRLSGLIRAIQAWRVHAAASPRRDLTARQAVGP
jgi:hypothetical protein